jgi:hypothetical protein
MKPHLKKQVKRTALPKHIESAVHMPTHELTLAQAREMFEKIGEPIPAPQNDGLSLTDISIPPQSLAQKLGEWYGGEVVVNGGLRRGEMLVIAGTSDAGKSQLSNVILKQLFPTLQFDVANLKSDELLAEFVLQYPQYKIKATDSEISAVAYCKDFIAELVVNADPMKEDHRYWHTITMLHTDERIDVGPYAATPLEAIQRHSLTFAANLK